MLNDVRYEVRIEDKMIQKINKNGTGLCTVEEELSCSTSFYNGEAHALFN